MTREVKRPPTGFLWLAAGALVGWLFLMMQPAPGEPEMDRSKIVLVTTKTPQEITGQLVSEAYGELERLGVKGPLLIDVLVVVKKIDQEQTAVVLTWKVMTEKGKLIGTVHMSNTMPTNLIGIEHDIWKSAAASAAKGIAKLVEKYGMGEET